MDHYPLFQTFANEATDRIHYNLNALKDPSKLNNFKNMAEISKKICENGATVQANPLGF
jgi:hypothetical protein